MPRFKDNPQMLLQLPTLWRPRLVTFLLAALATASVGYWVLKWPAPTSTAKVTVPEPVTQPIDTAKVARLLGANPDAAGMGGQKPAVSAASRFKLSGVIALGASQGSALIAIDGQPAKPFRVGDHLTDELLLQTVHARSVTLAADRQGRGSITLELPPVPGAP